MKLKSRSGDNHGSGRSRRRHIPWKDLKGSEQLVPKSFPVTSFSLDQPTLPGVDWIVTDKPGFPTPVEEQLYSIKSKSQQPLPMCPASNCWHNCHNVKQSSVRGQVKREALCPGKNQRLCGSLITVRTIATTHSRHRGRALTLDVKDPFHRRGNWGSERLRDCPTSSSNRVENQEFIIIKGPFFITRNIFLFWRWTNTYFVLIQPLQHSYN